MAELAQMAVGTCSTISQAVPEGICARHTPQLLPSVTVQTSLAHCSAKRQLSPTARVPGCTQSGAMPALIAVQS
jgi:hypothetical protein